MTAEVLAVGPFRSVLVPVLEHPADQDTRELCTLAECLGVDPWDFNTHAIDAQRVRLEALESLLDSGGGPGPSHTDTFKALCAAGFQFYLHLLAD